MTKDLFEVGGNIAENYFRTSNHSLSPENYFNHVLGNSSEIIQALSRNLWRTTLKISQGIIQNITLNPIFELGIARNITKTLPRNCSEYYSSPLQELTGILLKPSPGIVRKITQPLPPPPQE